MESAIMLSVSPITFATNSDTLPCSQRSILYRRARSIVSKWCR